MNLRDRTVAFTALFLGAAWGASHGCSSSGDPAGGAPAAQAADEDAAGSGNCTCNCPAPEPQAPRQLESFAELLQALKEGRHVRTVLEYAKCDLEGSPGPDAIGGMDIGVYEYFAPGVLGNAKGYLATSENKLIQMQTSKVYNYVKLKLSDDDSVEIRAQYLDPSTLDVKMDETFVCAIDDGSKTKGVYLFVDP